jgi:gliding motility-associated-like protein
VQIGQLNVSGDQITVEAVFNRTAPYTGGPLFAGDLVSKHKDPVNVNYLLRPNDAEITTIDGIYHITPPVCDIELNKIYHVAMVYDGVTLKFYRNGFLLSQTPVSGDLFQNSFPTQIGLYNAELYNTNLIGYINEVKIWNVARTQAQIQANMFTPLPSPATQPGLLAYYTFSSLLNLQGNPAWNGTLGGAATINQTNTLCNFIADNDCCPPIVGTFTGNQICVGQTGLLTFHPTSTPINQPYTLFYSDQVNNYTQSNVQDSVSFSVGANPAVTTTYPLLKITDASSCTTLITNESATITVLPPGHFNISRDTSICINGSAQLNVSGGQSYIWTPAAYLNNNSIPNPVAKPSQSTEFFVSGLDQNSCTVLDSVKVNIEPIPVFNAPKNLATCKGVPVMLQSNNDPKNLYTWSPAASLDNPNSPYPNATPSQNTVYHLVIADPVCPQYDSSFDLQVIVNDPPIVVAAKSNDIDCSTLSSQLSASGASTYAWQPGTNLSDSFAISPVARINKTTEFFLEGISTNGCMAYDSVTVYVTKTGQNAFSIPNAFTPNHDGINDCFGIRNWGDVTLQEFAIYNRWGQKVFETKNPSACWDGTFQGQPQDAGGFVYYIKASSFCGDVVRQGTLLLIR